MTKNKRVFIPTSKFIPGTTLYTNCLRWEWTEKHGLWVIYEDGSRHDSSWGTLKGFLRAVRDRREVPVVELSNEKDKEVSDGLPR